MKRMFCHLSALFLLMASPAWADLNAIYRESLTAYRAGRVVKAQIAWQNLLNTKGEDLTENQRKALEKRINLADESMRLPREQAKVCVDQALTMTRNVSDIASEQLTVSQQHLLGKAQMLLDKATADKMSTAKRHTVQAEICRLLKDRDGEKAALQCLLTHSPDDKFGNYRYAKLLLQAYDQVSKKEAFEAAKRAVEEDGELAKEFVDDFKDSSSRKYFAAKAQEHSIGKAREDSNARIGYFKIMKQAQKASKYGGSNSRGKSQYGKPASSWFKSGSGSPPLPELGYWPKSGSSAKSSRPSSSSRPRRTYRSSRSSSRNRTNRSYRR